jgi:hypothetical protein
LHLNELGIRPVFNAKVASGRLVFNKAKLLENCLEEETNLWRESSRTSEIYKILTNCFIHTSTGENHVFEPREKDINELVDIFKVPCEEAVTAL